MATAGSDFTRASGPRALLVRDERLCVGGALLATFSLGFVEACLCVERRPIPLRFALKFAAVNVAPSAVWSSVSARHVALASSVPESALVLPNAWSPALPPAVAARRILALRTVRALRYVAGSYGLVWGVWRACSTESNGASAGGMTSATDEEIVVRVAPVGSALSRASKAKHGDHVAVVAAPRQRWQRSQAPVDWSELGIYERHGYLDDEVERLGSDRVLLVEVEIADAASAQHAARIVKAVKARAETSEPLRTVGVVSSALVPPFVRDMLDVCFNPLSTVLKALGDQCVGADCTHVVIVPIDDLGGDEAANTRSHSPGVRVRVRDVANGLLFQYGISSTTASLDTVVKLRGGNGEGVLVVVMAENAALALAASRKLVENGAVDEHKVCFVVNESLVGKVDSVFTVALPTTDQDNEGAEGNTASQDDAQLQAPQWVSIADVCDATLQAVREMLRSGMDASGIQAAVYKSYGPQWASDARPDKFSDIGRYI